jgi:hypothetical protein
MTFVVKTRGVGGLIVAEYECPDHGRFEATVQRENGDPPDTLACPAIVVPDDACCEDHGGEPCQAVAEWRISAPAQRVWSVPAYAASTGGDMKERPPGMLDTRPLAEGMPYTEWKKKQDDARRARRHDQLTQMGVLKKRIQVG